MGLLGAIFGFNHADDEDEREADRKDAQKSGKDKRKDRDWVDELIFLDEMMDD